MKSIVVPVNFTACAANAACYAADLAQAIHADVHLIHVIQVPVNSAELLMTQSVYEDIVESADIAMKQLQFQLTKRTNNRVKIDTTLGAGSIRPRIQDLCQQVKPYAVVLGAAGSSLENFLAGSTVATLLAHPGHPVLVVPETSVFQQIRRILLACDLEDIGSDLANSLPLIKELQEKFGAQIDIVTVETSAVVRQEDAIFEAGCWKEQLKAIRPEVHYIRKSKVEEGVLEYLGQHEADLIMVFPKKHGFFDFHVSQSRKLAQHSPVPVLSLQA
jgi:nucleotide-binding universal stress UspA family protein